MKNFVQEGNVLTLTAPYTRTAGQAALIGAIFAIACNDVTSGDSGEFARTGVFDITALSTATGAMGAKAYWDDSNKRIDTDSTVGMLVGTLVTAKTNGQTTARVALNGSAPSTAEGPQGAIGALTDSTGGSGTHDDTVADGLTSVAATAATSAAVTGTLTGTVDGALADIAATAGACAGGATPTATQVDTAIATAVASIVTGANEQIKELQTALNEAIADLGSLYTFVGTALTDLTVQNQNDSDITQKILELRTALIAAGVISA